MMTLFFCCELVPNLTFGLSEVLCLEDCHGETSGKLLSNGV
jgi:hypothetical protein